MIINKTRKNIYGATFDIGTTFFVTNLEDLLKAFEKDNPFLYYGLALYGFEILNIRSMLGSKVINDLLYICETNGKPIKVEDKEIDPIDALDEYEDEIDTLAEYIQPADDKTIHNNISVYEMNIKMLKDTLDEIAIQALEEGVGFEQLAKSFNELKF